jgi:ribosomal-protein-alanine N-acetyltransferase
VAAGKDGETPTLVASGGFFGPPQERSVEIGYSVLPSFQQNGYGTELAGALTEWTPAQPGVQKVVADAASGNTPSVRRLGFSEVGASSEPGHVRFEKVLEGRCWITPRPFRAG